MKLINLDNEEMRLETQGKERFGDYILFDFALVPLDVTPKRLVIQSHIKDDLHEYKISWRKLLHQQTIGDVVLTDKADYAHFVNGKKISGRMT